MMIAVELHISFAVDGEKMSQIKCNNGCCVGGIVEEAQQGMVEFVASRFTPMH